MTRWTESLIDLSPVGTILVKATLLLALGWMLYAMLLRANPRWRVLLWRGILVGLLALPVAETVLPELDVAIRREAIIAVTEPVTEQPLEFSIPIAIPSGVLEGDLELPSPPPVQPQQTHVPILTRAKEHLKVILFSCWALVSAVLLLRLAMTAHRVRRVVQQAGPAPEQVLRAAERVAKDMGCRAAVDVRVMPNLASPFLTGHWRPVVVVPAHVTRDDQAKEWPAIFAHELAHYMSRDILWLPLTTIAATLLWFHPLAWRVSAAHRRACEEVADAVAADYIGDNSAYSQTLARSALAMTDHMQAPGGLPMIRSANIARRLVKIRKGLMATAIPRRWVLSSLAIGFIGLGVLSSTTLSVHAYNGDPELLRLLLNARKDNMERISTWRGEATREKSTAYENGYITHESFEEVEFAYDRTLDAVRWNLVVPYRQEHYGALLKDDLFYRHSPGVLTVDLEWINTLVIWPKGARNNRLRLPNDFNPMWYFTCVGRDIDGYLSAYYGWVNDGAFDEEEGKSIVREGDIITWETGSSRVVNHWVFDLSRGGNLIQYHGKDSKVETQYDWSYEQIDGAWIPLTFEYENRQKNRKGQAIRISRRVVFSGNEINVPLADDEFTLERLGVTPGTEVSDQVNGVAYRYGEESDRRKIHYKSASEVEASRPRTPADALKGNMAPDFTAALLDGNSFTLSEHKGEIVILDFWATWCGPCRVAMPVLSGVAKEFADDGVRLYGVNLREEPERIRAYLEGQGLDLNVLLDSDGEIGDLYKATAIPQTVIVGRDGQVAIVHVGLWAMPTTPEEAGLTPKEQSKLIFDTLADALRKELRELIGAEAATDG